MANRYRSTAAILNQGIRNANDGLSTLQIKDGALNNISTLLDRLATLATQSASSTSNGVDIAQAARHEYQDVLTEIDREAAVAGLDAGAGLLGVRQRRDDVANGAIGGTIGAADVDGARPDRRRLSRRPARRSRG